MDDDAWARFAEFLPEAMLLVDGDGAVLAANRAAAVLLQRTPAQLAASSLAGLSRDDPQHLVSLLRGGSRAREPLVGALRFDVGGESLATGCETMQLRPRSATQPARVVLRLIVRHKSIERFVALTQRIDELGREISRRRDAESRLQDYSERLRVTLASIGDAVIATDAEGGIVLMNPVAEQLTGWTVDEARGRALDEVFVIIDQATRMPVENPVTKVLRAGTIVGLANHTLLIARDGSERPIDDSGAPIRDVDGVLVGVVLVFRDFTERHALELELQQKNDRLVEAARRKDEFMSMLAHELRNPLAPLSTGIQLLMRESLPPGEVDRIATMMQRQLGHMTRLVDDLLDVARLTQGKIELRRAPAEIEPILQQAVEMVRPLAEARQQALVVDVTAGHPVRVEADAMRLVQVFGNLLSNAIKFTGAGGRIGIHARGEGAFVEVVISDDGIGIDSALLPQVFDLFVQADRSLDRAQGGLGIGLTVVRSIVEMHGGEVAIHSAGSGLGTEVTVRLPVLGPSHHGAPATQKTAGAPAAPAQPLRVLVVDDNRDAGEMLGDLLQIWGHEAAIVGDGRSALSERDRWRPHAVLLDIGLPGISGHEVARRMRQAHPDDGMLLVAITGYGAPGDHQASHEAGFDEHLTKPVDLDRLQAVLAGHARRIGLTLPSAAG